MKKSDVEKLKNRVRYHLAALPRGTNVSTGVLSLTFPLAKPALLKSVLREMAEIGLVHSTARRGSWIVRQPKEKMIEEILKFRYLAECAAIDEIIRMGYDASPLAEAQARLAEKAAAFRAAVESRPRPSPEEINGSALEVHLADRGMHLMLFELARTGAVVPVLEQLWTEILYYYVYDCSNFTRTAEIVEEHAEWSAAVRDHDAARAKEALGRHLNMRRGDTIRLIAEQERGAHKR
jgi:DNA-binding GntR family transcriptional regulator